VKKLPAGIQSFEEIRSDNYIYVDKTEFIFNLINSGKYYFLSRPRRFGKSLTIDTIKCLFEGKKELFEGLYIYDKWNWDEKYPVIRISFGSQKSKNSKELENYIVALIDEFAKNFSTRVEGDVYYVLFRRLINEIYKRYGKVVILIDEYDKPILDNIEDVEIAKEMREVLKGFYQVLKDCDEYLRFVMLTGVSKFSKVSIFSGLNNLNDITIDDRYSAMLGYTQEELEKYFEEYLNGVDKELMKKWYNGYKWGSESVYNPYDVLLFFDKGKKYDSYWFNTGTPSFLIKLLMQKKFYIPDIENISADEFILSSFDIENIHPVALLFQTGYLTIKEINRYNGGISEYVLSYPNFEVKYALNNVILKDYTNEVNIGYSRISIIKEMQSGKVESLINMMKAVFSGIPYNWYVQNGLDKYEGYYSSIFYSAIQSLGIECIVEDVTNRGRIDLTIKIGDYIYIFEFKVMQDGKSEKKAIEQILDKKYYEKYLNENKKIFLIGIEFSTKERNIINFNIENIKQ
jgi:hypothetical protein